MAATGDSEASSELVAICKKATESRLFPSQCSCSSPKRKEQGQAQA